MQCNQTAMGAVEDELASIWRDLLCLNSIGRDENFFEIGGHSILAVEMTVLLEARLDYELSLQTIFEAPTIRQLAERIGPHVREKGTI